MLPEIILGAITLPSYAVVLTIALAAGIAVADGRARRDSLPRAPLLIASVVAAVVGVCGAKLWSGVVERETINVFAAASEGGLSVFGGLVVGPAAAWLVVRRAGLRLVQWTDTAAIAVAVGYAIGRLGCLLAGCCHGEPTTLPIAVTFDDFSAAARPIGVPLHPTQIYASLGGAALAAVQAFLPSRPAGLRTAAFLAGYGILRTLIEPLRGDWRGTAGTVPFTTLAAVAAIAVGVTWLVRLAVIERRARHDGMLVVTETRAADPPPRA